MFRKKRIIAIVLISGIILFAVFRIVWAADPGVNVPKIRIEIGGEGTPQEMGVALQIFFLLTVLSLAPAFVIMVTSFTRIIVILSLLRSALALRQLPPNQILIGLALFLTFFVMSPVWMQIKDKALDPYMQGEITQQEAWIQGIKPVREFMIRQTRKKDLSLFLKFDKTEQPDSVKEVPLHVLIPSFITSELKTAFQIGFVLYIPFLIIDIVVSSIIMSMGMFMLPPVMISLPFKILLFVLVDGWDLVIQSIITSFR